MLYILKGKSSIGKSHLTTLFNKQRIEVYDEPFNGQPLKQAYIWFTIQYNRAKNKDILLVTHNRHIIDLAKTKKNCRVLTVT